MERIITISSHLWLVVEDVDPFYDDGLFTIRDDTGHDTLIDRDDIPALIEELHKIQAEHLGKKEDVC